ATLQCGINDANGNLPGGNVTNNGTLIFNQTSDFTAANLISGSGSLTQNGPNTLALTAANIFKGVTPINAGALALSGNGSIAASSTIALLAGAILSVTGRVDQTLSLPGAQTLQANGDIL